MEEKKEFNYWKEILYLTAVFMFAGILQLMGFNLGLLLGLFIICIQLAKIYDFFSKIKVKEARKR